MNKELELLNHIKQYEKMINYISYLLDEEDKGHIWYSEAFKKIRECLNGGESKYDTSYQPKFPNPEHYI